MLTGANPLLAWLNQLRATVRGRAAAAEEQVVLTRRCFSMRHSLTHFNAALLVLFLGGIHVAQGADKPTSKDLGKIQPPGGAPLRPGEPGTEISVDFLKKASKRLEAAPEEDLDRWVVELERLTGKKLDGEL